MTINNPVAFCAGLWDWSILDGCFGDTKIKPTDLEGFVERSGNFLVLETKAPGTQLKAGQMITFRRLINTGFFTVIIVWGETNEPEEIMTLTKPNGENKHPNASIEMLRRFVGDWFDWANQTAPPKFI